MTRGKRDKKVAAACWGSWVKDHVRILKNHRKTLKRLTDIFSNSSKNAGTVEAGTGLKSSTFERMWGVAGQNDLALKACLCGGLHGSKATEIAQQILYGKSSHVQGWASLTFLLSSIEETSFSINFTSAEIINTEILALRWIMQALFTCLRNSSKTLPSP